MELPLYNQNAENIGTVELSDTLFGLPANNDLVYQVVTAQLANKRQNIAHAKGRGEVSGGGKKPWQQKGTGRARHGSIRSPIWRGGGVTHGPTNEKNFKKALNRKMVQKALKVALSSKVRDGHVVVLDALESANGKTKEIAATMKKLATVFGKPSSVLLVMPEDSAVLFKASRNLNHVDTIEARNLSPLSVLSSTFLVMPKVSLEAIEKLWADRNPRRQRVSPKGDPSRATGDHSE